MIIFINKGDKQTNTTINMALGHKSLMAARWKKTGQQSPTVRLAWPAPGRKGYFLPKLTLH